MRLDVLPHGTAPPAVPEVEGTVLIPDLLRAAPRLRGVLDRHGLRGCGGPLGPAESLEFFARAHEVPLEQLLTELRHAVTNVPAEPVSPGPAEEAGSTDGIYRPFFLAGILVTLTLGAVWGAYLLLRIAWTGSFSEAGLHEVNAHGHAQIFGWVGLFVMGFAYQAFPRFKNTALAFPRLAWASLALLLIGLVGRSVGEPLAGFLPGLATVAVLSAWVEVLAIGLFVGVIVATWRAAGKALAFYDWYIVAALAWFVAQAVGEALYLQATLAATGRDELVALVAGWQGTIRDMQIHGFALLMILGVSQRLLHAFYGLPRPARRLSAIALVGLNLAVLGEALGLCLMSHAGHAWAALWYASVWLLTGCVVALLYDWRVFGRTGEADRSLKFVRAAYAWLLLSLAMLVLLPVYQFVVLPGLAPAGAATTLGFSHAYYGAIRHAITVGFISLMIVGVAAKIVPTLSGVDARRLAPLWAPFMLINTGCALRVTAQTLTDFTPRAFPVAGVSGLLEVTGLALWGAHLAFIMMGRARLRAASARDDVAARYQPGARITADHRVGDVLDARPALLDKLIALGFSPLSNPLLRRTVARRVTFGQACQHLGLEVEPVLAEINRTGRAEQGGCTCCRHD